MQFAITFGQRYNREEHPHIPEATGYSFALVEAEDEVAARHQLKAVIDNVYAFIYPFDADFLRQIGDYGLHQVVIPTTTL